MTILLTIHDIFDSSDASFASELDSELISEVNSELDSEVNPEVSSEEGRVVLSPVHDLK